MEPSFHSVRRELRLLKAYALVVTALLGTLSLAAFKRSATTEKFTEIDVERINSASRPLLSESEMSALLTGTRSVI